MKYTITTIVNGKAVREVVVDGVPIVVSPNLQTFIHRAHMPKSVPISKRPWVITEVTTGYFIGSGKTKAEAIASAKKGMASASKQQIKAALQKSYKVLGYE